VHNLPKSISRIILLSLLLSVITGGCTTVPEQPAISTQKEMYLKDVCDQNGILWQWDQVSQVVTLGYKGLKAEVLVGSNLVLIDKDLPFVPVGELKRRMSKKPSIQILNATPCIEGLFLTILDAKFSQEAKTTDSCKCAFEGKYIPQGKKSDKRVYAKIFPRGVLDERRQKVIELDAILRVMGV